MLAGGEREQVICHPGAQPGESHPVKLGNHLIEANGDLLRGRPPELRVDMAGLT